MKIENEDIKLMPFQDLARGTLFEWKGDVYLRTIEAETDDGVCTAALLRTGGLVVVGYDEEVIALTGTLTVRYS